jgi:hypothetical protein
MNIGAWHAEGRAPTREKRKDHTTGSAHTVPHIFETNLSGQRDASVRGNIGSVC